MKQVEVTGKTIQLAVEEGLKKLDTTLDKVDIEVLNEGGLFKKAKVLVKMSESDEYKEIVKESTTIANKEETKIEKVVVNNNESKEDDKQSNENKKEIATKAILYVSKFLDHMLYLNNLVGEVKVEEKSKDIYAQVNGEYLNVFIGFRGDTLDAIQVLLNTIVYNKFGYKGRVFLDIEGYKQKRVNTLEGLAKRMAKQVVQNKKSISLEPMNSYERRVIHSVLQDFKNVSTHSEGEEPKRHLIIDYVE